jgi:hypothetical protein
MKQAASFVVVEIHSPPSEPETFCGSAIVLLQADSEWNGSVT